MNIRYLGALYFLVLALYFPGQLLASTPYCSHKSSDLDGDGFGWENNKSCKVNSMDEALLINFIYPTSPSNVISISWPVGGYHNPFSTHVFAYEIWNDEELLATVSNNMYLLRVSDLAKKFGCIRIRALRGTLKSELSTPACYFVQSYSSAQAID